MEYRKYNRLPQYDYSQSGHYSVTICTYNRIGLLGNIEDDQMILNECGLIISECWHDIPNHYRNVTLDESVIMPNHIHGIIVISSYAESSDSNVGTEHCSVPTKRVSLSQIVKSFKEATIKRIRSELGNINFLWQRSFYDHVIRDEKELIEIREYIVNNPKKWELDIENAWNDRGRPLYLKMYLKRRIWSRF